MLADMGRETVYKEFNSLRLVKHEAGFPNPQWALISPNQLPSAAQESITRGLSTN